MVFYPQPDDGIVVEQLTAIWRAFIHFHLVPRMPPAQPFYNDFYVSSYSHKHIHIFTLKVATPTPQPSFTFSSNKIYMSLRWR